MHAKVSIEFKCEGVKGNITGPMSLVMIVFSIQVVSLERFPFEIALCFQEHFIVYRIKIPYGP